MHLPRGLGLRSRRLVRASEKSTTTKFLSVKPKLAQRNQPSLASGRVHSSQRFRAPTLDKSSKISRMSSLRQAEYPRAAFLYEDSHLVRHWPLGQIGDKFRGIAGSMSLHVVESICTQRVSCCFTHVSHRSPCEQRNRRMPGSQ